MRRPRLDFTTRRAILAVALVGLTLGSYSWLDRMRARSFHYWSRAMTIRYMTPILPDDPEKEGRIREAAERWSDAIGEKYRRAMYYPWIEVETDPPPPPGVTSILSNRIHRLSLVPWYDRPIWIWFW